MAVLESLPPRPLEPAELTKLNRADAVELATSLESEGRARSLIVATDSWVKALVYDDGWTAVDTVSLDDIERFEALRACESAIRSYRSEEESDAAAGDA